MITVKASRPYQPWLAGAKEVQVDINEGIRLADLLARLAKEWPAFSRLPLQDAGRLQSQVLIYSEGRFLRPEDIVAPDATIELLPPTAGG